jgi:hypothetical protein
LTGDETESRLQNVLLPAFVNDAQNLHYGTNAPYLSVAMPGSIFATTGYGWNHRISGYTKLIEDRDDPIHEWSFNHYFDALLGKCFHSDLLER